MRALTPSLIAILTHLRRAARVRGSGIATDSERRFLEDRFREPGWAHPRAEGPPGPRPGAFAADVLAWRRSALVITTIGVTACAIALSMDVATHWGEHLRHRTALGVALEVVFLRVVAPWCVAAACAFALLEWPRLTRSRRAVAFAAALELAPAFAIAMLPPALLVDTSIMGVEELGANAFRLAMAASLVLRIAGIITAALRSAVVARILIPESGTPGAIIAALVPMVLAVLVAAYVAINAVVQGWLLLLGWAGMTATTLALMARGRAMLRPTDEAGVAKVLRAANLTKVTIAPLALVCLLAFLYTSHNSFGRPILELGMIAKHWPFLCALLTNYLVTLVAGTDLIVHACAGIGRGGDADSGLRAALVAKSRDLVDAESV